MTLRLGITGSASVVGMESSSTEVDFSRNASVPHSEWTAPRRRRGWLLAVQEAERQVPQVGHLEVNRRAAFAGLGGAHALARLGQGAPRSLGLHGRQDGDHGERSVALRLASWDGGAGLS